jgi:hypothetical protein
LQVIPAKPESVNLRMQVTSAKPESVNLRMQVTSAKAETFDLRMQVIPAKGGKQWRMMESNHRRHTSTGLQPVPFGRSGNPPQNKNIATWS